MIEKINDTLISLSQHIPLELFVFLGSIFEEIVAPVPSPIVTTLAGTIALAQDYPFIAIFWIALIAALGKTLGSLLLYVIADKAEDLILIRLGSKLGISHKDVEKVGKYFNGSYRDYIVLIVIRTIPIIPSLPISVASGVIKMQMKLYLISTIIGSYLRSLMFIILGFSGFSAYQDIIHGVDSAESIVEILIVVALAGFIGWIYYKRRKISQHE